MRQLLRSKARAAMERRGIQHMNKPRWTISRKTGMPQRVPSIFAERWREFAKEG